MIRSGSLVIYTLFGLTVGLVLLGVIMVLSASQFILANDPNHNIYLYMGKQLIFLSLGLAGMSFFATRDYNLWDRYSRWIMLFAIVLLALVFSPIGHESGGGRRWIHTPLTNLQPSDFTKIAVIIYLSAVWSDRRERLGSFMKGVLFPMLFVGFALILILLEPDHSTTFFIGMVAMVIWFAAGGRILHVVPVFVAMSVGVLAALYHRPILFQRIIAFLQPEKYPDKYIQVLQARTAFAYGGWWGTGLGDGHQQLGYVPEVHTDFIFSTMGEELGYVKCIIAVGMFLALVLLGYWIALKCQNPFGRLLAVGCTSAIGLQTAINLAVVTGSMPTTGISLPFISYGGSSLLISMSLVGLLISVAKDTFSAETARGRPGRRA